MGCRRGWDLMMMSQGQGQNAGERPRQTHASIILSIQQYTALYCSVLYIPWNVRSLVCVGICFRESVASQPWQQRSKWLHSCTGCVCVCTHRVKKKKKKKKGVLHSKYWVFFTVCCSVCMNSGQCIHSCVSWESIRLVTCSLTSTIINNYDTPLLETTSFSFFSPLFCMLLPQYVGSIIIVLVVL